MSEADGGSDQIADCYRLADGDLSFDSQRRSWIQAASGAGVKTYGYLFTQPQPQNSPALGGA